MKRALVVLAVMFLVTACGDGGGSASGGGATTTATAPAVTTPSLAAAAVFLNSVTGTWARSFSDASKEVIVINPDGTFADNYCGSAGRISSPDSNSATAIMTISQGTASARCLGAGQYVCAYDLDTTGVPTLFGFNCGASTMIYTQAAANTPTILPGLQLPSAIAGSWLRTFSDSSQEILTIDAGGTYSDAYCGATGSIPSSENASNTTTLTISQGPALNNCLGAGHYSCTFNMDTTVTPNSLVVTCGQSSMSYMKTAATTPTVFPPNSNAGGTQISFSGTNVMTNLGYVGSTAGWGNPPNADFAYPQAQNTLTLGSGSVPVGATGTLTGNCATYPGSSISMIASPISAYASNVTGVITLSAAFMQANYPQGMPTPLGVAIDVWATNNQIYGGAAYICTSKDQMGNCHGAYLTFNP